MKTEERVKQLIEITNGIFKNYNMYEFMEFCSVGKFEIIKKTRKEEIRKNRQLAGVFGAAHGISLKNIGEELGGIDHATVLHGIRVVYDDMIFGSEIKKYLTIFNDNIDDFEFNHNLKLSRALSTLQNQLNKQIQL